MGRMPDHKVLNPIHRFEGSPAFSRLTARRWNLSNQDSLTLINRTAFAAPNAMFLYIITPKVNQDTL